MPDKTPNSLLHGTLDALILKTLASGPLHGYAIATFIEDASDETVVVEEGSLYPALYRMERRGWLEAEWGESELGRRAKLYRLTRQGRAQLAAETATWRVFSAGVSKILLARPAFAPGASARK
jgi:transcriptional regulator